MTDTAGVIADTYTTGNGGNISISAPQISMTGQSVISATSLLSSGNGGTINILNNQLLSIQGIGALALQLGYPTGIKAQSVVSGDAGIINVNSQNVTLAAGAIISSSSLFEGKGGQVTVNSSEVQLSGGSQISAISGLTNAGSVQITAASSLSLTGGSSITTSAGETGGAVTLEVGQLLYLLDSSITAYAGYPVDLQGAPLPPPPPNPNLRGGNINIDPQFVILDDSLISANDFSPGGKEGNILNTADFFFTEESTLHATGTIETTAPDLDLAGSLAFLPANLIDAHSQLREKCDRAANHEFSTFIVVGRGGIENAP
jgi:hypothetical protein